MEKNIAFASIHANRESDSMNTHEATGFITLQRKQNVNYNKEKFTHCHFQSQD